MSSKAAKRITRLAAFGMLLSLVAASPAHSAGTGGIVVTPIPAVIDGKPVTAFRVKVPSRGEEAVSFTLSNVEDGPRSAQIYTARVIRSGDGFVVGDPGSSPFVEMDEEDVTLQADELVERQFTLIGGKPADDELAAVVVQVQNGAVRQRASTLIYLERGREVPLPLLFLALAALLAAGLPVVLAARRRRGAGLPPPGRDEELEDLAPATE